MNGVAKLLGHLRRAEAGNVRIHPGDARDLMDVLPEAGVARAFLLYPDPWPKARHHRRRFVTAEHLGPLARALRPGAELRVATDIADYARQALLEVPRAGFAWTAEAARGLAGAVGGLDADALRGEGGPRGAGAALPDVRAGLGLAGLGLRHVPRAPPGGRTRKRAGSTSWAASAFARSSGGSPHGSSGELERAPVVGDGMRGAAGLQAPRTASAGSWCWPCMNQRGA